MVTMRDTAAHPLDTSTPVAVTPTTRTMNYSDSTPKLSSDYEKCREQRIKENLERMQKLGIHDLSLKLKSMKPNTHRRNNKPYKTPNRCISPSPSSVPSRRSSRLQNTPIVSYTEVDLSKKPKDDTNVWIGEHKRPEVYTEEHEKLLGDTKTEWTLFVDGYGKDGKKIYDQVRGKTCHQCRQKTLGYRTHCIQCNLVQGQFCGDCLYMRYGENVLEAMLNPNWICPVCRGICNCSLCRQAKGWAPTGVLYRKISSLGYKSVAHYLIQTHRVDSNSEKNEKAENSVCVKRSLPFSKEDVEAQKVMEIQSLDESGGKNVKLESGQDVSEHKNPEPVIESGNDIARNEGFKDKSGIQDSSPESEYEIPENTNPEMECKILEKCEDENVNMNPEMEYKIPEMGVDEGGAGNMNTNPESESKILETGKDENKNTNSELEYEIQEREVEEGEDGNKKTLNISKDNKADNEGKIVITPETKLGSGKKRQMVVVENSIAGRLRSRRRCI
ncbi:unnamed protein product [Lactuca saligna]|uniref:Zinc-finger domain-containing protein n=1 Tax=Lactuca saligna TaxID=75948 RepID=A0AA35Y397_LACSI|nr:unnamed protein product [Lactuca saligna]